MQGLISILYSEIVKLRDVRAEKLDITCAVDSALYGVAVDSSGLGESLETQVERASKSNSPQIRKGQRVQMDICQFTDQYIRHCLPPTELVLPPTLNTDSLIQLGTNVSHLRDQLDWAERIVWNIQDGLRELTGAWDEYDYPLLPVSAPQVSETEVIGKEQSINIGGVGTFKFRLREFHSD
jgi:hypothetical protein